MKIIKLISIAACALILSSCAQDISPSTYSTEAIGKASRVVPGTVVSMRNVKIDKNTGVGGLAGAGTGAVAGSTIGGSSEANIIGAIGGAVVGGLAGEAIEKGINKQEGVEFIIKLHDNSVISVTQATGLGLNVGQPVLVIYGSTVRIVPDHTQPGTWDNVKTTPPPTTMDNSTTPEKNSSKSNKKSGSSSAKSNSRHSKKQSSQFPSFSL